MKKIEPYIYGKCSKLMSFFILIKLDSIAWSLRRLYCPVKKNDLVLEVGSGNSPYFRSNILCDAYIKTEERFYKKLVIDRPMVISNVENLPFKDNSFDFVIASHVLEHSPYPEKFLSELQRVSKAGYIETPDAFMERLTNYTFHRLEITDIKDQLIINKKKSSITDNELFALFKNKTQNIFPWWVSKYPFHFHVRLFWNKKDRISYKIKNPKIDSDWLKNNSEYFDDNLSNNLLEKLKTFSLVLVRYFFSQHYRNKRIDLKSIMKCNKCDNNNLKKYKNYFLCSNCKNKIYIF